MADSEDALSKLAMAAAEAVEALAQSLTSATEEQLAAAQAAFCALDHGFMKLRRAADTQGASIMAMNMAGSTVATFRVTLRSPVSAIRTKIADCMGCRPTRLQMCRGECLMEDHKNLADYTSSLAVQVTALVLPLPRPSHAWDFRGCQAKVPDAAAPEDREGKAVVAHLENGASSSSEGVGLHRAAHVRLDPWRFGGATSVEMRLKIANGDHGYVLAFKDGPPQASPPCFFSLHVNQFRFLIGRGTHFDVVDVPRQQVPFNTFFHVVLTYAASVMRVYIDGRLAGSKEGCQNADMAMADMMRSGGADDPRPSFAGTISFLRLYHGRALDVEDITDLASIAKETQTSPK